MKGNILFVGLNYNITGQVAQKLSNAFDMFFLDVNGLIEYSLIDTKNVQVVCGMEYFEKQKKDIILSIKQYENTVINFPYSIFLEENIAEEVSSSAVVVYLKLTKNQIQKFNQQTNEFNIEEIAYSEFDKLLQKKCDICVKCGSLSTEKIVEKVIEQMKEKL